MVYRARLHWIVFVKAVVVLALGLALLFVLGPGARWVGGAVVVVGLLLLVPPLVAYRTTEFGVTNKRVIVKTGFIRRHTLELLLRQVEAISVDQSLTGRLLGFGSLTLTGTGGVREEFHRVVSPLEFRRRIQAQTA
ncbi:MAG TPA: PH domain-containing protein [Methylomirabilota bacterium]|nr:PH domain-containing protein [Methylomirabilota bacterium]